MAITPTAAKRGKNSTFGIEGPTPGTYVKVAEVTRIKPPGWTRGSEDATHLGSPDDVKEFIAGMKEMSDSSFDINWVPSVTDVLLGAFMDEDGKYEITAPNGVRIQFRGFITNYEPGDMTADGKMTASITVKPAGLATVLAAGV